MRREALLLVGVVLLAGACGGRALVAAHGGPDAAAPTPIRPRAFDVTATFTVTPPAGEEAGWSDFPTTQAFTLVLDDAAKRALAGTPRSFGSGALTRAADGTALTSFVLAIPLARSCTRQATIEVDAASFAEFPGALTGTGRGVARYQYGADVWSAPIALRFAGVRDATPPSFTAPDAPVDPLAPFELQASEPLGATASASLVAQSTGEELALTPVEEVMTHALVGFLGPVMLHFGETYVLRTKNLVDLAGNASSAPPLVFTTRARPPLAAQDGFESVTGDTFGGAGVLADGPLTAITGRKSLLLNTGFGGGFGFLPYSLGPSLTVRLAVPTGAKVLRFDRQLIAPDSTQGSMFVGAIRLASVGQPVETTMNLAATDFQQVTLAGNGDVYVSPVATIELPLPPGVTNELTFEIAGVTFQCGLPPPPTVLVVDNLRID